MPYIILNLNRLKKKKKQTGVSLKEEWKTGWCKSHGRWFLFSVLSEGAPIAVWFLPALFFFQKIASRKVDPDRFYSVLEENDPALLWVRQKSLRGADVAENSLILSLSSSLCSHPFLVAFSGHGLAVIFGIVLLRENWKTHLLGMDFSQLKTF